MLIVVVKNDASQTRLVIAIEYELSHLLLMIHLHPLSSCPRACWQLTRQLTYKMYKVSYICREAQDISSKRWNPVQRRIQEVHEIRALPVSSVCLLKGKGLIRFLYSLSSPLQSSSRWKSAHAAYVGIGFCWLRFPNLNCIFPVIPAKGYRPIWSTAIIIYYPVFVQENSMLVVSLQKLLICRSLEVLLQV